jgi:phage-related protein
MLSQCWTLNLKAHWIDANSLSQSLSSLTGLLGMPDRQLTAFKTLCAWRKRGEECRLLGAGVCQPALSHPAMALG